MIVARVTQHGDVGKTTPAPHVGGQSYRQGKRIALVNTGLQGCPPDWSEQCAPQVWPYRLARDRCIAKLPSHFDYSDHIVTDGPPALCRRIDVVRSSMASRTVDMPWHLPAREFLNPNGERS
jgi:hypothetical protein